MIRKYIFGMWVLCISYSVNAQNNKRIDCVLLNKAIEAEIFQKQFYICSSQEDISIIDTSMYFKECKLSKVCNRNLTIYNKLNDSMYSKTAIVIYRVDNFKHTYSLYFYRPQTGASLSLKFKYKNSKVRLFGYEVGAF